MSIVTATPALLSGVGVPYALEADLDASTAGQYGPKAGRPELTEDSQGRRTGLALGASGAQAATTTILVQTHRPGNVGNAGYIARRMVAAVTDTYWRGADLPNLLVGAAFPGWSALANQRNAHALTLDDDTQVIVCEQVNGVDRDIKCYVWSASSGAYAAAVDVRTGLDGSHILSPALLAMPEPHGSSPDPVLLCAYWNPDDTNDEANIDISYSRDGGTTWSIWAAGVLPAPITINAGSPYYTLGRIRMAMVGANVVLFAHLTASTGTLENIFQYASNSNAAKFVEVGSIEGGYPDAISVEQTAWLGYIDANVSVDGLLVPIRNAFELANINEQVGVLTGDVGTTSGGAFTYGSFCIARDGDRIYVWSIKVSTNRRFGVCGFMNLSDLSTDFINVLHTNAFWDDNNSTATEIPTGICATFYRGQARIYCTMTSGTGTFDDRLTRLDLGGPATINMRQRSISNDDTYATSWDWTTIPTALASAYGATFTGAGTHSISTNTGWETLTTSANTAYYERAPTADATQQIVELIRVKVDSGGGVSSRVIACGLRAAGVGYGFEFELRFSTTQIRFRNVTGAADQTTVTVDTTAGVDVLMAISGSGVASAWYRTVGSDEDRYFIPIEVGFQLTDDAGAGGTANVVMWGNRASGTAVSRWVELGGNAGSNLGSGNLASGLTLPTDLRPIPYSSRSYALGNVYLKASAGPTFVGDAWTGRPDADHAVRYLAPVGDPDSASNVRGGQRTSSSEEASAWWGTATSGDVVLRFPEIQNRYMTALTALHTEGCNGRDPSVIAYNVDGAAYTVVGTLTNSTGGLRYLRSGASSRVVRVDTSGTSSTEPYIRAGSLKGGWFHFTTDDKVRPILDNTEGAWSNDGAAAVVYLTLGGIDGTEATSGTGGVIVYPRATFVFASTLTTEYGKFGLRWGSAPDLYEAQLRARVMAVCPVEPLLYAGKWGTGYALEDPAQVYQAQSGIRRGRQIRNAPRRTLTIPLGVLLDQRPLLDTSNVDSIVYKAYNNASHPIAGAAGDDFGKLLGAWQRAGGSQHPVVWLPRINPASATQSLVGDAAGFYARITSAPEYVDELGRDTGARHAAAVRMQPWTLSEET